MLDNFIPEYLSTIGQFPIMEPSTEDFRKFCPHLSDKQIQGILESDLCYFAAPVPGKREFYAIFAYSAEEPEVEVEDPDDFNAEFDAVRPAMIEFRRLAHIEEPGIISVIFVSQALEYTFPPSK